MPNKTIYVKDGDLPLLEQAQEQLGESVSSMFAEFLRERIGKLTPVERSIIELTNQVMRKREAIQQDSGLPGFVDAQYAEVEVYAENALKSLRAGGVKRAKVLWYAANAYHEMADRDHKAARDLNTKIAHMLA